ncbi:hypothetical protein [Curtobacterium sp. MCJR17_043]
MAAGSIVAAAAGAVVRTWEAGDTRSFLFAAPSIAEDLVTLVRTLEEDVLGD